MIFRRSSDVPILDDYAGYRPYLRHDFGAGEAGKMDHGRPLHLSDPFEQLKTAR